jgi:hypothetical protein
VGDGEGLVDFEAAYIAEDHHGFAAGDDAQSPSSAGTGDRAEQR